MVSIDTLVSLGATSA